MSFRYPTDWQQSTTSPGDSRLLVSIQPTEPELQAVRLELFGTSNTASLSDCTEVFQNVPACRQSTDDGVLTTKQIDIFNQPKKITIRLTYPTQLATLLEPTFEKLLATVTLSKPDPRL